MIVEVTNLSKSYRRLLQPPVQALQAVSLNVGEGRITALIGPNGAGKTSTLYAILGLMHVDCGTIRVFNKSQVNTETKKYIGFQSEIFHPYPFHTANQALRYYGRLHGVGQGLLEERVDRLLKRFDLEDARHQKVKTFSKGMTQRLGLAQALLHEPKLLILDEPTSGLDPTGRRLVADTIIQEKAKGTTVLLSSHILSDVEKLADDVIMLSRGRVVLAESMQSLGEDEDKWEISVTGSYATIEACCKDIDDAITIDTQGAVVQLSCHSKYKQDLIATLINKQIEIDSVNPKRQTLEELYLKLCGAPTDASS